MDLGQFSQPILLFGGPYSNLEASLALKNKAELLQIPPSHIFCTGDIVAYCGSPSETVELIRDWGVHVLMGNCEESFASDADDCGCGFEENSSCSLLSVEWFNFAKSKLSPDHASWFANLPRRLSFSILDKHVRLVHGSATSINQFIFNSSPEDEFIRQFKACDADIIIAGHSGIPFSKQIGNKLWHNAGAIGMPANDGTANTWYSILSIENGEIEIQTQPLEYDFKMAQQTMREAGLDNLYARSLSTGLWPSQDILSGEEKAKQGHSISPTKIGFSL